MKSNLLNLAPNLGFFQAPNPEKTKAPNLGYKLSPKNENYMKILQNKGF